MNKNNIITIENKVRHLLKSTNAKYTGKYEFVESKMIPCIDDFDGEEYFEESNPEIYLTVACSENDIKKLKKIQGKLIAWGSKKFNGLFIFINF